MFSNYLNTKYILGKAICLHQWHASKYTSNASVLMPRYTLNLAHILLKINKLNVALVAPTKPIYNPF